MSRASTVRLSDSLRVIFIFWFRWLSIPRCAQETPNDPSSATRPTRAHGLQTLATFRVRCAWLGRQPMLLYPLWCPTINLNVMNQVNAVSHAPL